MRCRRARALLPLLLDNALPLGEHHEAAEHFRKCTACAALKASHEGPLPSLPPLPAQVLAQFGRELDAALEEELALIELSRRRQRWQPVEPQPSRAWPLLYGALLGATASFAVFGVALPWSQTTDGSLTSTFHPTAFADGRAPAAWSMEDNLPIRDEEGACLPDLDTAGETQESSLFRPCLAGDASAVHPVLLRTSITSSR